MKKALSFFLAFLMVLSIVSFTVSAATFSMTKSGSAVTIDGSTFYQKYSITSGVNGNTVTGYALEFKPSDGYIPMAFAGKAGGAAVLGTQASTASSTYGYDVAGVINGSFFSMDTQGYGNYGTLVDYVISNGRIQSAHVGDNASVVAFGTDGSMNIVNSLIEYKVYANGTEVPGGLYYINKTSGTKSTANWSYGVYYFDSSCGTQTMINTSLSGYHVLCDKQDNTDLIVGGTLKGKVVSVTQKSANTTIGSNQFVLYMRSDATNISYLKNLKAGDPVDITANETVASSKAIIEKANSVIENVGWLIQNGEDQTLTHSTIGTHSVTYKAYWTAMGVKSNGSYVFLTTGQITLKDVAKALLQLGCVNAVRLDGGGSTAMYVKNSGYLMNQGRSVADCMMVVKKSSMTNSTLTTALRSALTTAKGMLANKYDASLQAVVTEAENYLNNNSVYVSGDVRRLTMKLKDFFPSKKTLQEAITASESIKASEYGEAVLSKIFDSYKYAVSVNENLYASNAEITKAISDLNYYTGLKGNVELTLSRGSSYTVSGATNYTNFEGALVDDGKRLTDGVKGGTDGSGSTYSAWSGTPTVIVDLGSVQSVDKVKGYFAAMSSWGIAAPGSMAVSVSTDGNSYTSAGSVSSTSKVEIARKGGDTDWISYSYTLTLSALVKARYVKIVPNATGNFVWMSEAEVIANVKKANDIIYVTGVNKKILSDSSSVFTPEAGILKIDNANVRWSYNIFLKWSPANNAYVVTSTAQGSGSDLEAPLKSDELVIGVHAATDVGGSNRELAQAQALAGNKLLLYGIDLNSGKSYPGAYIRFVSSEFAADAAVTNSEVKYNTGLVSKYSVYTVSGSGTGLIVTEGQYPCTYNANLTDGKYVEASSYSANDWFSISTKESTYGGANAPGGKCDITLDLGAVYAGVYKTRVHMLNIPNATDGVGAPAKLQIYLSSDNKNFTLATEITQFTTGDKAVWQELTFSNTPARFVRFSFTAKASHTFINELEVYNGEVTAFLTVTGSKLNIDLGSSLLKNVSPSTTVALLKEQFINSGNMTIKDLNGNTLSSTALIGTGCTVSDVDNTGKTVTITVLIMADIDGDGKTTATDYTIVKAMFQKKVEVTGVFAKAAEVTGDGRMTVSDYILIKRQVSGTYDLYK